MTPSLILDSSVALTWCFADEMTPATKAILARMRDELAIVPSIWFLELTNVLAIAERKGRITAVDIAAFMTVVRGLLIVVDNRFARRAFTRVLPICRSQHLTSYDACYLDLAVRKNLPTATLDEELRRAAAGFGLTVLGR